MMLARIRPAACLYGAGMYFELMYLDRQVMKIARLRDPLFITESELLLAPDCSEHSNRTRLYTHDSIR